MRQTTYVRMLVFPRLAKNILMPLSKYAKSRKSQSMMQGQLMGDIRIGEGIHILVDFQDGERVREELETSPVIRLESGHALTETAVYQFVRIPRQAPAKKPSADRIDGNQKILLGTKFATASQRKLLKELLCMAELCGVQESYAGLKFRAKPLIAGFSGAGKSRLIELLCDGLAIKNAMPCSLLRIAAGSWSLINSTNQPYTLNVIRDFVRVQAAKITVDETGVIGQGAVAVILLDEIDKLTARGGMAQSWYRNVVAEFISLADCDSRLRTSGWTENDIADFQNVLVIGAGAFLDGVPTFADQDKDSHLKAIDTENALPDEVRRRFNSHIHYLEVPDAQDYRDAFKRLYLDLHIPLPPAEKLEKLVSGAEDAKKGMRFLEEHLADLLIAHPKLRRPLYSSRPPKPVPWPATPPKPEPKPEPESRPKSPPTLKQVYDGFAVKFRGEMLALEEPLRLVQVLMRTHKKRFVKFLVDAPGEKKGHRAEQTEANFQALHQSLLHRFVIDEKQKESLAEGFWHTGCAVLDDIETVVWDEHEVLFKAGCLLVFVKALTRLSRLLSAYEHYRTITEVTK